MAEHVELRRELSWKMELRNFLRTQSQMAKMNAEKKKTKKLEEVRSFKKGLEDWNTENT